MSGASDRRDHVLTAIGRAARLAGRDPGALARAWARQMTAAVRAHDRDVRVLVRRPERGAQLASWGAELVTGDVTDPASLRAAMDGCTHVVHLVAMIQGKPNDFHRVMTQGTRSLVAAAKEAGVTADVVIDMLRSRGVLEAPPVSG